jgi:hypothetical protein
MTWRFAEESMAPFLAGQAKYLVLFSCAASLIIRTNLVILFCTKKNPVQAWLA